MLAWGFHCTKADWGQIQMSCLLEKQKNETSCPEGGGEQDRGRKLLLWKFSKTAICLGWIGNCACCLHAGGWTDGPLGSLLPYNSCIDFPIPSLSTLKKDCCPASLLWELDAQLCRDAHDKPTSSITAARGAKANRQHWPFDAQNRHVYSSGALDLPPPEYPSPTSWT